MRSCETVIAGGPWLASVLERTVGRVVSALSILHLRGNSLLCLYPSLVLDTAHRHKCPFHRIGMLWALNDKLRERGGGGASLPGLPKIQQLCVKGALARVACGLRLVFARHLADNLFH